jgi:hypothetical protein
MLPTCAIQATQMARSCAVLSVLRLVLYLKECKKQFLPKTQQELKKNVEQEF